MSKMLNIFPISYPKGIALSEIIRHASFPIEPRVMKKARSWRRLESSVGVLILRKFDKIRNFHRKKFARIRFVRQGRPSLNFKNIPSKNHEKSLKS
jgi:hypothetical protein